MKNICNNCGMICTFSILYNDPKLLKCSNCGGYQWIGNIEKLEDLYNADYFNGGEYVAYQKSAHIYKLNLKRKLKAVLGAPYLSSKTQEDQLQESIFELGSATGEYLKILRERNFHRILGSEISLFCRETAAQNGFQLLNPQATDFMLDIKKFSPTIICAWDVWEHLDNPQAFFKNVISSNPQIKLVALTTVDSGALVPKINKKRWRQFHPPTHLNYPTRQSFEIFFNSINFQIKTLSSFGYYRPISDYLSVFFGRKQVSLLPLLFKIPLYVNLFDIQMVVAEREKKTSTHH